MRYKRLLLTLHLAVTLALPTAALAQFHGPGGPGGFGGPMAMPLMMFIRHANLTADQQAKVRKIMDANFAQARPLMKQLHTIHDQIADKLMGTAAVIAADIAPLQHQEAQIHQQLGQQMLTAALQIRAVLTPEQLARASELHIKLKALHTQMETLMGDDVPPPMALAPSE
jgi:Spy/CpxP family protein refolding chaperone